MSDRKAKSFTRCGIACPAVFHRSITRPVFRLPAASLQSRSRFRRVIARLTKSAVAIRASRYRTLSCNMLCTTIFLSLPRMGQSVRTDMEHFFVKRNKYHACDGRIPLQPAAAGMTERESAFVSVIARLARGAQPLAALPPYGCGLPPAGAICAYRHGTLSRETAQMPYLQRTDCHAASRLAMTQQENSAARNDTLGDTALLSQPRIVAEKER